MIAREHGFLDQILMLAILTCVQMLEEILTDCLHAQHMAGALQDHRMEDYEPLRIPVTLSDSR